MKGDKFKERYCSESEKGDVLNKDKKVLSDDAFALGEVIDDLKDNIIRLRLRL